MIHRKPSPSAQKLLLAIPMKDPADAKTRLSVSLSPLQREQLAIALFLNVVDRAKQACDQLTGCDIDIAVISSSPTFANLAKKLGLKWIDDGGTNDLNQAVERAAEQAEGEGYQSLCLLPGDLSDPSVPDLMQLLSYPTEAMDAVVCPSKDLGTNALVVPLPNPITFGYGERSFHHHYRCAVDAGLLTVVLPLNSLRRDVDTLTDLHDLQRRRPDVAFWSDGR